MKNVRSHIIIILLAVPLIAFYGFTTEKAPFKIEKSLPQSKLAYYNDSFDKLRGDLWERSGYTFTAAQMANFKAANMTIEDGKLKIGTRTGGFSKGGFVSKYQLRGDFDVQLSCYIDFLEGLFDMDQLLGFGVVERGKTPREMRGIYMVLLKRGESADSIIVSHSLERGKLKRGNFHRTGDFHGTLRFVRIGQEISTLYKRQGKTQWKILNTFSSTRNDAMVSFALQNFVSDRNSITAKSSVTAVFDNFKINAAQGILEEEI